MNLSFWEYNSWFSKVDFTIVGSGIVGLHCALRLREKHPDAKIIILEKGMLPEGASTKNAGFACFGSISEILDDLNTQTEQEVVNLISRRWEGLNLLRSNLGDESLDFKNYGGYELFLSKDKSLYSNCIENINYINKLIESVFKKEVFSIKKDQYHFKNIEEQTIYNSFESQIDTGKMMQALLKKAHSKNILILNNQSVTNHAECNSLIEVELTDFTFKTKKLIYTTNGFASKLTNNQVQPARAQVLITKPIKDLKIKGTFHLDQGYYYFRNIENRILFGGGRNLDFEGETTTSLEQTTFIQNKLEQLLKDVILPETPFEIEHRWSGIMGVGSSKKPIIEQLSNNVYCGVRLGGMGIAIGSLVGKELADIT